MLSLPRTPTAMTAVSGSGPLCGSGARAAPAAARHQGDVPCAATADVRHGDLRDRVPLLPQPGGHERKGTKQGRICSGTKDICP